METYWVNEGEAGNDTSGDDFSSHEFKVEPEGPVIAKQEATTTDALKELQERSFDV